MGPPGLHAGREWGLRSVRVSGDDALETMQAFIDERWAVAQPKFYPKASEGPRVDPQVTSREAEWFMASIAPRGAEPPLIEIDDDRFSRSYRTPPRADGLPTVGHFFESPGRLRLEEIAHMAAMARLRDEFGWPPEHLVCESPTVVGDDGLPVLSGGALDILLLEQPCSQLTKKMTRGAVRSRVGIEVKADAKKLDALLGEMGTCQPSVTDPVHREHRKCQAIDVFRPHRFVGVAAGEVWRVFDVVSRDGRFVVAEELPGLDDLRFPN
jgi:hypothetical protein